MRYALTLFDRMYSVIEARNFDEDRFCDAMCLFDEYMEYDDYRQDDAIAAQAIMNLFGHAFEELSQVTDSTWNDYVLSQRHGDVNGVRTAYVHRYEDVRADDIWNDISTHIPKLCAEIEACIRDIESGEYTSRYDTRNQERADSVG